MIQLYAYERISNEECLVGVVTWTQQVLITDLMVNYLVSSGTKNKACIFGESTRVPLVGTDTWSWNSLSQG